MGGSPGRNPGIARVTRLRQKLERFLVLLTNKNALLFEKRSKNFHSMRLF
jgi:hypothetical protein